MEYFYARVSTRNQNADRQLDAAQRAGFSETCTFVDYESGKDFNRENWTLLQTRLTAGDALFVKSIDRLGRNYKEILRVWQNLTKDRGIDVVVLDMPLLDTRSKKNLLGTFIADLVLQVLSFVAENERVNIKERQKEGIAAAKERGVKFGRPRRKPPLNFQTTVALWESGAITMAEASRQSGLPYSTFRNLAKRRPTGVKTTENRADAGWEERAAALRAAFGSNVFTTTESAGALGVEAKFAAYALAGLVQRGELYKVASGGDLRAYSGNAENVYSFDSTKTVDDAIKKYDPIPPGERSLDVQLFGQERERYERIVKRRFKEGFKEGFHRER